jgi:formamidopyrimidine-DNA glycosylase
MPEPLEICAQLVPRILGRTLARVEVLDPRSTRLYDPLEVAEALEGKEIAGAQRRERYLVLRLESWPTLGLAEPLVARPRPVVFVAEESS